MVEFDRFERLAMEDPELAEFIDNLAAEDSCEELSSAVKRGFGMEPILGMGAAAPIAAYVVFRLTKIGLDFIRGLTDIELDKMKADLIVDTCETLDLPKKSVGRIAEDFCKHVCSHSDDDPILKRLLGVLEQAVGMTEDERGALRSDVTRD